MHKYRYDRFGPIVNAGLAGTNTPVPARPCRARSTISSGLSAAAKAVRIRFSTLSTSRTTGRSIVVAEPGGVSLSCRDEAVEVMILKKGEVRNVFVGDVEGKRALGGLYMISSISSSSPPLIVEIGSD